MTITTADATTVLRIVVPGVPRRQPRHKSRAIPVGGGKFRAQAYEPEEAKSWKGELRLRYERAVLENGGTLPFFPSGPVALLVVCAFPLAKTHERKHPVPRAWKDTAFGGDWDNLGKLYSDAGNGMLFADDGQVCAGVVLRWIGAQGEAPSTTIFAMRPEALAARIAWTLRDPFAWRAPASPAHDPVQPELFKEPTA